MDRPASLTLQLRRWDVAFCRRFDRRLASAAGNAGAHVTCRRGCTACCIGVFDITALDAARLREGFTRLRRHHPRLAAELAERAADGWRRQRAGFPGELERRTLVAADDERERYFSRQPELPCVALNPRTGACVLYEYRPLSCRSYGLPIICGKGVLPPCPLNFVGAPSGVVRAAAVDPDPVDREGELLAALQVCDPEAGDTTVAAALAALGSET